MLQSMRIKNLTAFPEANLQFSPYLNVFAGENGTGKSHLLKAAYCLLAVSADGGRRQDAPAPTKSVLQTRIADKLVNVFRPEALGRIARRKQGRERCEIGLSFRNKKLNIRCSFSTKSKSEVSIDHLPGAWVEKPPVFLPTRELLSIYPGFVAVYDNHYLEFEETWRDTCLLLGAPSLRGPKEKRVRALLGPLEKSMGGKVVLDKGGRFYLSIPGQGKMEIPLVAEGLRKIAMLARLISTGSLLDQGYLFWDEPETNLNPKLIKEVAGAILHLSCNGVQVFIATHSLFLMRELYIQMQTEQFATVSGRFFSLSRYEMDVHISQGDSLDDVSPIVSLDEELAQSDRYLEIA
ncbi:AAA family ATPase [Desulfolithobacter sp.]